MFGYKWCRRYSFCQTKKAAVVMEGVEDLKTELESLKAAVRKIDRIHQKARRLYLHRNRESLKNTLDAQARFMPMFTNLWRNSSGYWGQGRPVQRSRLEGAAREKVRCRSPEEKNTPQKEAFGEKATVYQLVAEIPIWQYVIRWSAVKSMYCVKSAK